ncbi:hypothetical protein DEI81_00210 [Curtobacterium sp. MCBD17_013]|uniref:hypothetical protein n=1 Tax=Curtobacterium sp. MCBD17_013 TaxID=2175668 RepID=UPI000DA98E3E|nr:hypothetical protein [Curtobacterium sp. MCBD17_013]PZF66104.1 hypothetical protein DEI81_00210 [Curtobacterium sp. MCBD17_013]
MPVRDLHGRGLLDLAEELASRATRSADPTISQQLVDARTTDLRRSISTAYYAVFHTVSEHVSARLLGNARWTPQHSAVSRWVTHTDLVALARAAADESGSRTLTEALEPVNTKLAVLAQDFVDLQNARHGADYDDYFAVSQAGARSYITTAKRAVRLAEDLFSNDDASYMRFLGLAVGGVKVAKRR